VIADTADHVINTVMSQHIYIRVRWLHSDAEYPVELWSELNECREEVRKMEIWADGRVGYASHNAEVGGTSFGEGGPLPPLSEIAADPEFELEEITQAEFEECWTNHALS
jgi:hypothetical protein